VTPHDVRLLIRDAQVVIVIGQTSQAAAIRQEFPLATVYEFPPEIHLDGALQRHPAITRVDMLWIGPTEQPAEILRHARATMKRTQVLVLELGQAIFGDHGRLNGSGKAVIDTVQELATAYQVKDYDREGTMLLRNGRASIGRAVNRATIPPPAAVIPPTATKPTAPPNPTSRERRKHKPTRDIQFTIQTARQLVGQDWGTILEIGANDGEDSERFLACFPEADLYCFEPDPRAIRRWRSRIHDPRATLYEIALADHQGTVTLHQSGGRPPGKYWTNYGDWDKSGSILPFDRHKDNAPWMDCGSTTAEVACQTLDQWAADHPVIFDFLWIDVQGAELIVLQHGATALQRTRFVYAECDPRPNYRNQASLTEILDVMSDLGFVYQGEYAGFNHLWKNVTL
jgi:FkbM family methyltransferase